MSIIYCPVCGKNIKYSNTCSKCGYEKVKDYEVYPTVASIKRGIKSIKYKRQEYENSKFESLYNQRANVLIKEIAEQKKALLVLKSELADLKKQNVIMKKDQEKEKEQLRQTAIHEEIINQQKNFEIGETIAFDSHEQDVKDNEKQQIEDSSELIYRQYNPMIGDTITFGSYKQDVKGNVKKAIEWLVIDKKDNKLMIISRYGLDCKAYNDKNKRTTWTSCSLRSWLNRYFITEAFNSEEVRRIVETLITDNYPGNNTKDKIFLLSINEVSKYFFDDDLRKCRPTEYAKANNAWTDDKKGICCWWLRSLGINARSAVEVLTSGYIYNSGVNVNMDNIAVRPALWINL